MEEARIPDENVIGGVGNGWAVAITTLMNERAGLAFAAQAALQIAMRKVIDLAGSTVRNGKPALQDPVVRERARAALHRVGDLPRHQLPRPDQDHEERRARDRRGRWASGSGPT